MFSSNKLDVNSIYSYILYKKKDVTDGNQKIEWIEVTVHIRSDILYIQLKFRKLKLACVSTFGI